MKNRLLFAVTIIYTFTNSLHVNLECFENIFKFEGSVGLLICYNFDGYSYKDGDIT